MFHACGSAVSKVLAVSKKRSMPNFTYTYNCFESTCLPNFKESISLQIRPQYLFTWPIKSLWLWRHGQRWGQGAFHASFISTQGSTAGIHTLLLWVSGRHNCCGKWLMDLHSGSERPAHASLSPDFFFFKDEINWEEELFVWFYFQNAPGIK